MRGIKAASALEAFCYEADFYAAFILRNEGSRAARFPWSSCWVYARFTVTP